MFAEQVVDALRPLQFRGKKRLFDGFIPPTGERQARVFGCEMRLDLSDLIQRNVFIGSYEREETAMARRWLRPGDTFVDVGANVGYFTALAAGRVGPRGRVISLEPSPYAFGRLKELVSRNGLANCTTLEAAVGDAPGELELFMDPGFNNHTPTLIAHETQSYARVRVETLDAVAAALRLERIHLLKVDVEGYEPKVLAGAKDLLTQGRISAVLMEFNDWWLRRAGRSSVQLLEQLRNSGFDPVWPRTLPTLNGKTINALLVHRSQLADSRARLATGFFS